MYIQRQSKRSAFFWDTGGELIDVGSGILQLHVWLKDVKGNIYRKSPIFVEQTVFSCTVDFPMD